MNSFHHGQPYGINYMASLQKSARYRPVRRSSESRSTTKDSAAPVTTDDRSLQVPFAISRTAFSVALGGFAVVLTSLQIVDSYARAHDGLGTLSTSVHYLWTYGPTAGTFRISSYPSN